MSITQQADDEFTLLILGQQELVVIANATHPCWNRSPVYVDRWHSTIYFTVDDHEYHSKE